VLVFGFVWGLVGWFVRFFMSDELCWMFEVIVWLRMNRYLFIVSMSSSRMMSMLISAMCSLWWGWWV